MKKPILKKLLLIGATMILSLLFCISLAFSASADAAADPIVRITGVSLGLQDRVELLFRVSVTGLDAYLDEHPEARAADFLTAFRDPEIDLVMTA